MPWNGAGSYVLPPAFSPEINGTVVDATRYNGLTSDVAAGIAAALAKNGENVPTANLPMGGFRHTGAGAASIAGMYLTYGQTPIVADVGAVGAPSYSFLGSLTTGIYSPAVNQWAVATAAVQRLLIDAVGVVTINAPSSGTSGLVVLQNATGNALAVQADFNGVATSLIDQLNANTGAHARQLIRTVSGLGGDPFTLYNIGGGAASWAVGIDNSDGDHFKISANTTLGVNDFFGIVTDGRVYANGIHNGTAPTGTTRQYIASGTYTPTDTPVTNVTSVSPGLAQWIRVGNVVIVSGSCVVDTAAGGSSVFRLSLPLASDFTSASNLGGAAAQDTSLGGPIGFTPWAAVADTTNNAAKFTTYDGAEGTAKSWSYTYMYLLL